MSVDYDELLALAVDVAAEAAELVRTMRSEGVDVAGSKTSPTDIVTRADHACEQLVRTRLLAARPDDGFLGEEGDDLPGTSGVRWVVDPIDGTVNYMYGSSQYAVCIAAQLTAEPGAPIVAGVVHVPVTGVVHTATRGGGSFRNGERLAVRDVVPMGERLIGTGFNYQRDVRAAQASYVARLLPRVRDVRRPGSCALDLCAVAAGETDGYAEECTHLWDDAAAGLVATEAGARFEIFTSPSGNRLTVCSPAGGFEEFRDVLDECGFIGNTAAEPGVH